MYLLLSFKNTGKRVERVKVAIVGAGVIGLAVAEALSRKIQGDIVVLERHRENEA